MAEQITITGAQRDALYQHLLIELSGFGDLRTLYEREIPDLEGCYRLGRRLADDLRLIQDGGLGWGDTTAGPSDPIALTLPPAELHGILTRLRQAIISDLETNRVELEAAGQLEGVKEARDGCVAALEQLGS